MNVPAEDPIVDLAVSVSALLADFGYAFVEDDKVLALAEALRSFFTIQKIPVDPAAAAAQLACVGGDS